MTNLAAGGRDSRLWQRLCEATAERYRSSGRFHHGFVRGKLKHDPLYHDVLASGMLAGDGPLVDLGCGRGTLLALIDTARDFHARGDWAPEWGQPPQPAVVVGVERHAAHAAIARRATAGSANILAADLRTVDLPRCRTVLFLDVLLYLPAHAQEAALRNAVQVLEPGGSLVMREPDAAGSLRFHVTRWAERASATVRGHWSQRYHYRGTAEWKALLELLGLRATARASWQGTPFANVILWARKAPAGDAQGAP